MTGRLRRSGSDDRGSSPVEFVLVGALLTLLTLGVLQLGLAVYVRNVVQDAAVEGAWFGARADTGPAAGAARTRAVIARAVGGAYSSDVRAEVAGTGAHATVLVTVRAALPLVGLFGATGAWEVTGRAPVESFE